MKIKYVDLTSVQLAKKGLEHFNKNPIKYKKMIERVHTDIEKYYVN